MGSVRHRSAVVSLRALLWLDYQLQTLVCFFVGIPSRALCVLGKRVDIRGGAEGK